MDVLELQKQISNLLIWRKQELLAAKKLAENAQDKIEREYLQRVWVLVLYAHCDNFLKEASKVYFEYVKSRDFPQYHQNFMWMIFRSKQHLVEGKKVYRSIKDFENFAKEQLADVIVKEVLTQNSFRYKYLRFSCDWLLQIDFDHLQFFDFCKELVLTRDSVAHGEESYVDIDKCNRYHEKTVKFIESLSDALIVSAEKLEYEHEDNVL
jgi:hypothetical protein